MSESILRDSEGISSFTGRISSSLGFVINSFSVVGFDDGGIAAVRRLFVVVDDESEDDEYDVVIRERCVGGLEREEATIGGFDEVGGSFVGRCEDCLLDELCSDLEESSAGDVRDSVVEVGTVTGREGLCLKQIVFF